MIKKVMKTYYAHKSNVDELLDCARNPFYRLTLKNAIDSCSYDYDIIKYDSIKETISFIQSPDWDTANEPITGDSNIYDMLSGEWKFKTGRKKNFQIYHHKWSFVADDYTGFDIEESKRRSELWQSIPEIASNKSRIGNQDFWFALLDKYNIEH